MSKQKTYMGIDLSLVATGLAVVGPNDDIRTFRTLASEPMPNRLWMIATCVAGAIEDHDPAMVAMESLAYGADFMTGKMAMVHGAVLGELARRGLQIPYYVSATTLKKFATGDGRAQKSDIKMTIFKKWGREFKDDNQADAFILSRIARMLDGGIEAETNYEEECLKTIRVSTLNELRAEKAVA